jgi:hypothetical protein
VTAKPTDFQLWKGLVRVKEDFFSIINFQVENGQTTRFCEDTWFGDLPLANQYPSLYNIVQRKNVLVTDVLLEDHLNIEFRRTLTENKWESWLQLVCRLMRVILSNEDDNFLWNLTTSGLFTVKSMYVDMMNGHTVFLRKYV